MLSRALRAAWAFLDRIGWVIALIFLAIGYIVVHGQGNTLNGQAVTVNELRVSQLRGCHRLNVERARNNRGWLHVYKADQGTLAYDDTFRTLILLSLRHPAKPVTAEGQREINLFLAKLGGEIAGVEQNLSGIEWTPLTRCYPATFHPIRYVPPPPHPFAVIRKTRGKHGHPHMSTIETLPPPSALHIGRGE